MRPRLTVGMACHNDFDGVYFSVQALSLYHSEVMEQTEILVIDNDPNGHQGGLTRDFMTHWIRNGRYVAYSECIGTAAPRNRIFEEALGDYVLCIDAHVLLMPGSLEQLIDYYEQNPALDDLLQGPMLCDDLKTVCTHMDPVWRAEMFGIWGTDEELLSKEAERNPREIEMHGLGLFSCRKSSWLGFHGQFAGFGGEEGYIHQKYRNFGRKTRLLPFLKWVHRFPRTHAIQFPCTRYHKIRNYLIGWVEVGLPLQPIVDHFRPVTPREEFDAAVRDSGCDSSQIST